MLLKVIKHNGAHELFRNTYVVLGQHYYYIDSRMEFHSCELKKVCRVCGRRFKKAKKRERQEL